MPKIILTIFTIFFLLFNPLAASADPDILGEAYILIDGKTGQVLTGKNIDSKLYPASTTKILTTIIALEKGKMDDQVTISGNVPLVEGTKVYLREGETISLEKLLHGAMVHSANDAALAIAEHISGSQEAFVKLMNEKAKEIGAKNSNFVNPHGLTEEDHYTTAYDLALIGRYAMENPVFRELAQEKVYDWEGEEWQTRIINKNKFLWRMDEATGVKMGYTSAAKYTLVASAQKDGRELIAVILGSNDNRIWDDAKALLTYGFDSFQSLTLSDNDEIVATLKIADDQEVNLVPERSVSIAVANDGETSVEKRLVLGEVAPPIDKGKVLGELVITVNGEERERIPVKSMEEIKKPMDWQRIGINALAGIFLLQIGIRIYRRYSKNRRRRRVNTYSSSKYNSYRY